MRVIALAAVLFLLAASTALGRESRSAALYQSGFLGVNSISCAAAGECAAGGSYRRGPYHEAFVVSETGGSWGNAIEVPGTATLNTGGDARVLAISCAAPGECAAGGYYLVGRSVFRAFVVNETGGIWGNVIKVPGASTPARYAEFGGAGVGFVSCAAPGECGAGGYYVNSNGDYRAFVLSETGGSWGSVITVPGNVTLHHGYGFTGVNSISCGAPGECVAGGPAADSHGRRQAFVVSETNGSWGNAVKVPGMATLNAGGSAGVNSVSCVAAGECTADGYSVDADNNGLAFVVSETNGSWGNATELPGTATLSTGGWADAYSISCAAAGECAAGGGYVVDGGAAEAFVASETSGSWGDAIAVPGLETLNSGGEAEVDSISCGAAGDCAAGGEYKDGNGEYHAFVVSETNGSWGNAIEVPGAATLSSRSYAVVNSVSCPAAGNCAAGGFYIRRSGPQAFVVDETNGSWANATLLSNFPVSCVVPNVVRKTIVRAKRTLHHADCVVGTIKRAYSNVKKGRVIAQRPNPGTSLSPGHKVALTVSKGRKT